MPKAPAQQVDHPTGQPPDLDERVDGLITQIQSAVQRIENASRADARTIDALKASVNASTDAPAEPPAEPPLDASLHASAEAPATDGPADPEATHAADAPHEPPAEADATAALSAEFQSADDLEDDADADDAPDLDAQRAAAALTAEQAAAAAAELLERANSLLSMSAEEPHVRAAPADEERAATADAVTELDAELMEIIERQESRLGNTPLGAGGPDRPVPVPTTAPLAAAGSTSTPPTADELDDELHGLTDSLLSGLDAVLTPNASAPPPRAAAPTAPAQPVPQAPAPAAAPPVSRTAPEHTTDRLADPAPAPADAPGVAPSTPQPERTTRPTTAPKTEPTAKPKTSTPARTGLLWTLLARLRPALAAIASALRSWAWPRVIKPILGHAGALCVKLWALASPVLLRAGAQALLAASKPLDKLPANARGPLGLLAGWSLILGVTLWVYVLAGRKPQPATLATGDTALVGADVDPQATTDATTDPAGGTKANTTGADNP